MSRIGTSRLGRTLAIAAMLVLLAPISAQAQKSRDTLRVAFADPIATVLQPDDPKPETSLGGYAVFDLVVCYDGTSRSFKPQLAKSWVQVDPRTIDFTLRDDVRFHDGNKLTTEDVAYTLTWLADPNSKLRFAAGQFDWMERAEALDATHVRVVAKTATPLAMIQLATSAPIVEAKLHRSMKNRSEYGRKTSVGTGPYKVVSVDPTSGVNLVKNDDYRSDDPCKPAGSIGHLQALPIPDKQTQIAQLATGGIDLIQGESKDETDMLAGNPMLAVTASQGLNFFYLTMDSTNRSGNAALSDVRVRRAISQAINRELIGRSVVPGGSEVRAMDALCMRIQLGCDFSAKPPPYDLAAARLLLADAGYADGFDAEITAMPGCYTLGEAIAGELRKLGIRATVSRVTFASYRQKQVDGKIQMLAGQWTMGGLADASASPSFYFDGDRDYWRDSTIGQLAKAGLGTSDEEQRRSIYSQLYDRVNAQSYILPISTQPVVLLHTKDLSIPSGSLHIYGADLNEMRWN
jgi:peptide/nickel transport system substrate-binding protein